MGARSPRPGHPATIQNADINVTPFVDIMLVMLIIFMVVAPLATVSIKLDLPPPEANPSLLEPVYVTVLNSGALMIGEQSTTLAALTGDLCATIGDDCTNERIFLRAEPDVDYRQFMAVMNTLNAEGFHQVGLLNEDIQ